MTRKRYFFPTVLLICLMMTGSGVQAQNSANGAQAPLKLSIEKAVELAVAHNENVRIADEAIQEAKGAYLEYAADAWPQLSGSIGYTRNLERMYTIVDMTAFNPLLEQVGAPPLEKEKQYLSKSHSWDFRIMAEQNLFTFGKVSNAIKIGSVYKDLAKVQKRITVADVALQARQAFLQTLFARESLKVAQSNLERVQETYDVTKAKTDQGLLSQFDLLVVESELAAAKPELLQAEHNFDLAKKALLNVIGEPLDREIDLVGELAFLAFDEDLHASIKRAKTQRPALRALTLQESMYETSYKLYRASYLPTLRANGAYARTGGSDKQIWPEDPEDDLQPSLSFGVSLYIPLFDGLRGYGQMRQMAAQRQAAKWQYKQASRGIELEITQLFNALNTSEKTVEANQVAVDVATRAYELATLRYENGLGTRLEVTQARDNMNKAMLAHAASLYQLNHLHVQLRRALGE